MGDSHTDPREFCEACPSHSECKLVRHAHRPCERAQHDADQRATEQRRARARAAMSPREIDPVPLPHHSDPSPTGPAPWQRPREEPVTLPSASSRHRFFRTRLEELGMFGKDSDYGGMIGTAVSDLSALFANQRHSGTSAEVTLGLFNQLMQEYNGEIPETANRISLDEPATDALQRPDRLPDVAVPEWDRERRQRIADIAAEMSGVHDLGSTEPIATFASGAKSSKATARYDLIPWHLFADRLAKRYTEGAAKYGEYNWQKGLTERDYVLDRANHALAHLHRAVERMRDMSAIRERNGNGHEPFVAAIDTLGDDDLAAAMWGIIFLMAAQRGKAEL